MLSKSTLTDFFLEKKPLIQSPSVFSCNVANSSNIKIRLKLVYRKSDGKILYAQEEKDFADLLVSYLTFPLGGVVRILGGNCSMGNIDGLYKSVADLHENTYLTREAKKRLVDPHLAPQFKLNLQILPIQEPRVKHYCYYNKFQTFQDSVVHNQFFISDEDRSREYGSYEKNVGQLNLVSSHPKSPKGNDDGYIKGDGLRTYMVTDDLVIAPSSTFSILHLINHFKIPLDDMKEKLVTIGIKEVRKNIIYSYIDLCFMLFYVFY